MKKSSIGILHYSAPPIVGGVEAVMQAHLKVLVERGHEVRVIAGRGGRQALPAEADLVLVPDIDSRHPKVLKVSAALEQGKVLSDFESLTDHLAVEMRRALAGLDTLIIHNVFTKHFNLALTAALHRCLDKDLVPNCVAWCHDFTWTSRSSRSKVHPGFPWDLLRTRRPDTTYVVVSQQRQSELAGLFECDPGEIRVVYNGVDPHAQLGLSAAGHDLLARLGLLNGELNILMPVRVTRAKNIELSLEVVAELKKMGCQARLVVTGPPDPHDPGSIAYYKELLALRRRLEIEEEFRFVYEEGPDREVGYELDLDQVGELIRYSDLVFMPSHQEGFGMPVLEAGLAGVPVIASEIPAAVEIGGPDVNTIERTASAAEVADLILTTIADNPVRRFRARIRQSYTWDAIYERDIKPLLAKANPE